jgi:hypothetical protein
LPCRNVMRVAYPGLPPQMTAIGPGHGDVDFPHA